MPAKHTVLSQCTVNTAMLNITYSRKEAKQSKVCWKKVSFNIINLTRFTEMINYKTNGPLNNVYKLSVMFGVNLEINTGQIIKLY